VRIIQRTLFTAILYATISCGGNTNNSSQKSADKELEYTETTKEEKSNGVFEILSFNNDSVQFRTVVETKFYALALMSDSEIFEGKSFSNSVGTVGWANGARFWAGSTMRMPASFGVGAMTLPEGAVLTIYGFGIPEGLKAIKIKFVTEGTTEMYYNILKSSWDK
jgi:hypothetical protein